MGEQSISPRSRSSSSDFSGDSAEDVGHLLALNSEPPPAHNIWVKDSPLDMNQLSSIASPVFHASLDGSLAAFCATLDTLVETDLVKNSEHDCRTNSYALTRHGQREIEGGTDKTRLLTNGEKADLYELDTK